MHKSNFKIIRLSGIFANSAVLTVLRYHRSALNTPENAAGHGRRGREDVAPYAIVLNALLQFVYSTKGEVALFVMKHRTAYFFYLDKYMSSLNETEKRRIARPRNSERTFKKHEEVQYLGVSTHSVLSIYHCRTLDRVFHSCGR
ncbi:UNVERIFIED_CONTAM: hypothetical protein FKN15_047271 [Acipenser sinensis]